jgi:hypothetical protein
MAPHLEDRLLIPSHIFLPTSVVIPALPMHMDSRKKLGIESWNSKIRWCTYLEDQVGLQEFGIWNGRGDISGYGILWRLFGFGRELFWHLDNWIGYEHRAGSQQMFPSRI